MSYQRHPGGGQPQIPPRQGSVAPSRRAPQPNPQMTGVVAPSPTATTNNSYFGAQTHYQPTAVSPTSGLTNHQPAGLVPPQPPHQNQRPSTLSQQMSVLRQPSTVTPIAPQAPVAPVNPYNTAQRQSFLTPPPQPPNTPNATNQQQPTGGANYNPNLMRPAAPQPPGGQPQNPYSSSAGAPAVHRPSSLQQIFHAGGQKQQVGDGMGHKPPTSPPPQPPGIAPGFKPQQQSSPPPAPPLSPAQGKMVSPGSTGLPPPPPPPATPGENNLTMYNNPNNTNNNPTFTQVLTPPPPPPTAAAQTPTNQANKTQLTQTYSGRTVPQPPNHRPQNIASPRAVGDGQNTNPSPTTTPQPPTSGGNVPQVNNMFKNNNNNNNPQIEIQKNNSNNNNNSNNLFLSSAPTKNQNNHKTYYQDAPDEFEMDHFDTVTFRIPQSQRPGGYGSATPNVGPQRVGGMAGNQLTPQHLPMQPGALFTSASQNNNNSSNLISPSSSSSQNQTLDPTQHNTFNAHGKAQPYGQTPGLTSVSPSLNILPSDFFLPPTEESIQEKEQEKSKNNNQNVMSLTTQSPTNDKMTTSFGLVNNNSSPNNAIPPSLATLNAAGFLTGSSNNLLLPTSLSSSQLDLSNLYSKKPYGSVGIRSELYPDAPDHSKVLHLVRMRSMQLYNAVYKINKTFTNSPTPDPTLYNRFVSQSQVITERLDRFEQGGGRKNKALDADRLLQSTADQKNATHQIPPVPISQALKQYPDILASCLESHDLSANIIMLLNSIYDLQKAHCQEFDVATSVEAAYAYHHQKLEQLQQIEDESRRRAIQLTREYLGLKTKESPKIVEKAAIAAFNAIRTYEQDRKESCYQIIHTDLNSTRTILSPLRTRLQAYFDYYKRGYELMRPLEPLLQELGVICEKHEAEVEQKLSQLAVEQETWDKQIAQHLEKLKLLDVVQSSMQRIDEGSTLSSKGNPSGRETGSTGGGGLGLDNSFLKNLSPTAGTQYEGMGSQNLDGGSVSGGGIAGADGLSTTGSIAPSMSIAPTKPVNTNNTGIRDLEERRGPKETASTKRGFLYTPPPTATRVWVELRDNSIRVLEEQAPAPSTSIAHHGDKDNKDNDNHHHGVEKYGKAGAMGAAAESRIHNLINRVTDKNNEDKHEKKKHKNNNNNNNDHHNDNNKDINFNTLNNNNNNKDGMGKTDGMNTTNNPRDGPGQQNGEEKAVIYSHASYKLIFESNTMLLSAKALGPKETKFKHVFQLLSPGREPCTLQAESEVLVHEWLDVIQNAVGGQLKIEDNSNSPQQGHNSHGNKQNKQNDGNNMGNDTNNNQSPSSADNTGNSNNNNNNNNDNNNKTTTDYNAQEVLSRLQQVDGNKVCCDCNATLADPWIVINLGALICLECSGAHRQLGVTVSKVRSVMMDRLDTNIIKYCEGVGNVMVNRVFLENFQQEKNASNNSKQDPIFNITPDSPRADKVEHIRQKYQEKRWVLQDYVMSGMNRRVLSPQQINDRQTKLTMLLYNGIRNGEMINVYRAVMFGAEPTRNLSADTAAPLFESILYDGPLFLTCMLQACADATTFKDERGWNILHYAAYVNSYEMCEISLMFGGSELAMTFDKEHKTPRQVAEHFNSDDPQYAETLPKVLDLLLQAEQKYEKRMNKNY